MDYDEKYILEHEYGIEDLLKEKQRQYHEREADQLKMELIKEMESGVYALERNEEAERGRLLREFLSSFWHEATQPIEKNTELDDYIDRLGV